MNFKMNFIKVKLFNQNSESKNDNKNEELDEYKFFLSKNIEKIEIDASIADVRILASDFEEIKVYGEEGKRDIKFSVKEIRNKVKVVLKSDIDTFSESTIKIDVFLSRRKFKNIIIKTYSGNIEITNGILVRNLEVKSYLGDIVIGNIRVMDKSASGNIGLENIETINKLKLDTVRGKIELPRGLSVNSINAKTSLGDFVSYSKFLKARILTENGNVKISNPTTEYTKARIFSEKGNVTIELNNIGHIDLLARTSMGDIVDEHKDALEGNTAKLKVETIFGNINVRQKN